MSGQGEPSVFEPLTIFTRYHEYINTQRELVDEGKITPTMAAVNLTIGYPALAVGYTLGRIYHRTKSLGEDDDGDTEA